MIQQPITISATSSVCLETSLMVGSQTDSGQVVSDSAQVGQTFGTREVHELHLPGPNYQQTVSLPGFAPPNPVSMTLQNLQGSLSLYANGQAASSNVSTIDGIDNNEPLIGVTVQVPSQTGRSGRWQLGAIKNDQKSK